MQPLFGVVRLLRTFAGRGRDLGLGCATPRSIGSGVSVCSTSPAWHSIEEAYGNYDAILLYPLVP